MKNLTILNLQFFSEGEGDGGLEAVSETPAEENTENTEKSTGEETPISEEMPGKEVKSEEQAPEETKTSEVLKSAALALEEKLKNAEIERAKRELEQGEAVTKETYPGFDLKTELQRNPEFKSLLRAGISVRRAYEVTNFENILASAMRWAALTAGKKAAENISTQSRRVQENSVLDRAASVKHTDVNSLTRGDILKILDEVSRGAKIKF